MLCQAFEFKHLPMAGGIFAQHPQFLERSIYILQEQEKVRRNEEAARERRSRNTKGR